MDLVLDAFLGIRTRFDCVSRRPRPNVPEGTEFRPGKTLVKLVIYTQDCVLKKVKTNAVSRYFAERSLSVRPGRPGNYPDVS